jgi:hypothetical protein
MAEPIAVVSIAVILFLGATGINLAIEDRREIGTLPSRKTG